MNTHEMKATEFNLAKGNKVPHANTTQQIYGSKQDQMKKMSERRDKREEARKIIHVLLFNFTCFSRQND